MKERPILFNGPMVQALLDQRKTMTRRVIKTDGIPHDEFAAELWLAKGKCPYGQPGDVLWVRETWGFVNHDGYANVPSTLSYRADGRQKLIPVSKTLELPRTQLPHCGYSLNDQPKWRPSIFMPRWASRITLEVTDVRVERLLDISEEDAMAEGIESLGAVWRDYRSDNEYNGLIASQSFFSLWDTINGGGASLLNPYVWVVEFKRIDQPTTSDKL